MGSHQYLRVAAFDFEVHLAVSLLHNGSETDGLKIDNTNADYGNKLAFSLAMV